MEGGRGDHQGQGGSSIGAPAPTREADAAKRFRLGTHRIRPPEETWATVAPLLERAGVTRVAEVTALDRIGIPVFQAIRPASRNLSVSQGKGATREAARVSAVMEALELWCAEDLGALPQASATLREMDYANPVPVAALPWIEGAVALDAAPISWIPAASLSSDRRAWLPRQLLEVDFSVPEVLRPRMFYASSNGLASGNCREEALLHALCELIERHALHRARRDPAGRRAIDPASVDEPTCRHALDAIANADMKVGVYDITWEVGVATFVVDLVASDLPNVWLGAGTHPSPAVALSRALTEAAQSRLAYVSGARDDLPRLGRDGEYHRAFEGYRPPVADRPFPSVADLSTDSVARDLGLVVERLERAGHEPFWVDLGRPGLPGVAVVRAFAPGLREVRH